MFPSVAIIIVNWNGKADTLECLASLRLDKYSNKQIIVVDNGSTNDSVAIIRAAHPEVTVLEAGANLGFTGGNNVGINFVLNAGVDFVYLLNNDTTVEPDALQELVNAAEANPQYGLLTPVIYYFDKPEEAWFAGSLLDLTRGEAVHDNSKLPSRSESPYEIPWASGCAMLIRADVIRQLGGFDDRYFLNWEDVDLSLRIKNLGSCLGLVPAARIYHKVGRSFAVSGTGLYYHVRNHLLFVATHAGCSTFAATLRIISSQVRECLRFAKNPLGSSGKMLIITVLAIRDHFQLRYGHCIIKAKLA